MTIKDLYNLHKELDGMDLEKPKILLISGSDAQSLDALLVRIRKRLRAEIGQFESIVFTAENGEDNRLLQEVFNVPLFSPYRLLIIKQADVIFKNILASTTRLKSLKGQFQTMPDRTWLIIQYDGKVPAKMTGLFKDRLLHLVTKELYLNQIPDLIKSVCHKLHLKMEPDAMHYFTENITPKVSEIESRLAVLKELFNDPDHIVKTEEIREILFPGQGCNPFALIDGMFSANRHIVERELIHFNANIDHFMAIFKLMLMRTNEIRKTRIAKAAQVRDDELMQLLGHKSKHPFVQKKIIGRLQTECRRFDYEFLGKVYDLLIQLEIGFRSNVNHKQKMILFKQRIYQLFFS